MQGTYEIIKTKPFKFINLNFICEILHSKG